MTDAPPTTDLKSATVTLADGRQITLREPRAGELRGVKLLDVLQLDTAAHAVVIERVSALSALEFYALTPADAMALMTEVVGFFALTTDSAPASRMPGK